MTGFLLLAFCVVPLVELWLLIRIGSVVGAGSTILLVLITGVLGSILARSQGFRVLIQVQEALNKGQLPTEALFDGAFILAGGILLLTPGFLTDSVGFCFLLPPTRAALKAYFKQRIQRALREGQTIRIIRPGP